MRFHTAAWLWLLVAVGLVAAGYVLLALRKARYTVKFTNLALLASVAPRRPGWRRHVAATAFLLCLVALVVSLAGPVRSVKIPRERATVMVALDVSLSMEATDVQPTRIRAAKSSAEDFVKQLPRGFNVGLVSFAGTANVRVSPTKNHGDVLSAIEHLDLAESTAIGEAIFASLDAIKSVPADGAKGPPPARIVLLSDGYTTVGRPDSEAAEAAKQAHVPVSTIAFGTDDGTVQLQGQEVPVPVDRGALQAIADGTGGRFYAAASASRLRDVYHDLGSSIGYRTEPRDISRWFTGLALALGLAAAGTSLLWTSRIP
ncbi:MAG: VWA domain-containing protein [Mycobacteriales bacterium]